MFFLAAPMQAHFDVIAFDAVESHLEPNHFNHKHHQDQHHHDNDDEKKTEHHHHCLDVSTALACVVSASYIDFTFVFNFNEIVYFYTNNHTSKDLASLFHPPRIL
jgi:ABC-type Zn2+ transport system substrate-binding protein/surface adhesin